MKLERMRVVFPLLEGLYKEKALIERFIKYNEDNDFGILDAKINLRYQQLFIFEDRNTDVGRDTLMTINSSVTVGLTSRLEDINKQIEILESEP